MSTMHSPDTVAVTQLRGRGSSLLQLQTAQHSRRVDKQNNSSRCQQLSGGIRASSELGAVTWSSVKVHDTFSDDPRCASSHCLHVRRCYFRRTDAECAVMQALPVAGSQRSTMSFGTCS